MKRVLPMLLAALAISTAGYAGAAWAETRRPREPIDALIVYGSTTLREDGTGEVPAILVRDAAKLAALEGFFPGYRQRPTSRVAGGWIAGYVI